MIEVALRKSSNGVIKYYPIIDGVLEEDVFTLKYDLAYLIGLIIKYFGKESLLCKLVSTILTYRMT